MSRQLVTYATNDTIAANNSGVTHIRITSGAGHLFRMVKAYAGFNGITAADPPVLVELCRYTGDGTMTALTGQKHDLARAEAILSTGGHLATVEPAGAVVLDAAYVHMQGGNYTFNWSPTWDIIVPGTNAGTLTRLGLRLTSGAVTGTVKAQCSLTIEE